jgi:hypothetical protein
MKTKPTSEQIKTWFLHAAEIIDAFRLVPRLIVTMYGLLIYNLYTWFVELRTVVKTQCDAVLVQALVNKGLDIAQVQQIACSAVDIVGGPTAAQAAFITTVVGLATPMFMFYTNSGRKWGTSVESSTSGRSIAREPDTQPEKVDA